MSKYSKVVESLENLPKFIEFYDNELKDAKNDVKIQGKVENNIRDLPRITEVRYNQLQEIEAVLNYLNIQLRKLRSKYFKKYTVNYKLAMSSRDAEKWVDGEDEIVDFETVINQVALLRNKWIGVIKGLDNKQWHLGHVVRLRTAGMEDMII